MNKIVLLGVSLSLGLCTGLIARGQARPDDSLMLGFKEPPASARPRVWWHWMNGNVTKEGIQQDLEWMHRVGIGGVQNFDASLGTPQVVQQRLAYMTPEWQDAFRFAVDQAEKNGLEMAIASSAGWSETGGPWVMPEQAMKKLVWSVQDVAGGHKFTGRLPAPPRVAGPFQDAPLEAGIDGPAHDIAEFYRDVAVIAYRLPEAAAIAAPVIRNGGKILDAAVLQDGSMRKGIALVPGNDANACITFDYPKATRVAALRIALPISGDFFHAALAVPVLESSDDGVNFRKVAEAPGGNLIQHTISFPAVNAAHYRVCLRSPPSAFTDLLEAAAPGVNMNGGLGPPPVTKVEGVEVRELQLLPYALINRAEEKAGFAFVPNYYEIDSGPSEPVDVTPHDAVVNLTSAMASDGTLKWKAPKGQWRILRFGVSLTGKENHPATQEATGLEVDKLDRARVKGYLDTYFSRYEKMLGPSHMGSKGVTALMVDSIEVGAENWTESLPAEFKRRRGYDLTPWMPVLTGAIVSSSAESDRFLYDFRRTLTELISDSHYAQIAASARERGLTLYGEALEQGRPVLGDDMEMRRYTSVPMAALWAFRPEKGAVPVRYADIRGAASVAHIYGQNLVAAESLTSAFAPWAFAPRDLRPMIDLEFALGVNRPVIHTSVHQPLIGKAPGLSLAIFGQYFNRNETWAEEAGPWVSYLSRSAYLLQQGHYVADVLYFYGEESPLTTLYGKKQTEFRTGYAFDFANPDVLNRVSVKDGALSTASGMHYRVLYLGGTSNRMTLAVLKRLKQLSDSGAIIVGNKPSGSPSLSDDANEFAKLADTLFSQENELAGRVLMTDLGSALSRLKIQRDVELDQAHTGSDIMFLHRSSTAGEIYFLSNRRGVEERLDVTLRATGRKPEIWRADTGTSEPVSYHVDDDGTRVSLHLLPYDSLFVVLRQASTQKDGNVSEPAWTQTADLSTNWKLTFQTGRGAPVLAQTVNAGSWTASAEEGIKHFSGTGSYSRQFTLARKAAGPVVLDLGDVRELAEVIVNGRSLGILWHPPYRIDVSDAVHTGRNDLEVRVTNLWVNRLIGDAQPGVHPVTFTVLPPYLPDAPLRPSGLIGPVVLLEPKTVQ